MEESGIKSHAFQLAQLRSEASRVVTLLCVFGGVLVLIAIRAALSLVEGHRGEAWPLAALVGGMTAYEAARLVWLRQAIRSERKIPQAAWTANIFVETLLPTMVLLWQTHTSFAGPHRVLTSPAVLTYFLFIILSTLHLNSGLARFSGAMSATGYAAVAIYVFMAFPEVTTGEKLAVYGVPVSCAALLLIGGFAAGAVADQVRGHVLAALREAESQAKIAQMEHELGVARSIQQGLLPKTPPRVDGFDIAGWNQPADETGGDYFDWQELADGHVAVTVADVTGHGIGPALVMAACRAYARAGLVTEPDLRSLVGRLNTLLYEDLPSEKFVTLAAGVLNPARSTMQLISAGHGPLLFYSSAQDLFCSYDAHGLPLGLLPRFGYGCPQLLRFSPGDILVLVTDGFVEWANGNDEDFGQERLKEVIRTYRDLSADGIISKLYSAVVAFAGSTPQLDDLTALVVKRL